jgi:hypothetical protein
VEVIPRRENQACDKKLTESQNKNNTPSSPRGRRWGRRIIVTTWEMKAVRPDLEFSQLPTVAGAARKQ